MDGVRDVGDRGRWSHRDRIGRDLVSVAELHPDESGQGPDLLAKHEQRIVVEDGDRDDLQAVGDRTESVHLTRRSFVRLGGRDQRRTLDACERHLPTDELQRPHRHVDRLAEHDAVRTAQDAEQRPASTAVLVRALDETGDLDELYQDAADASRGRHRPVVVNA